MPRPTLRDRIEHASSAPLELFGRRRLLLPALLLVGVVVGLFGSGPVAAVAGSLAVLVLAWLAYLAWPHLRPAERALRLAVIALFVVFLALS